MEVDYYFDFSCPYAYLGATQFSHLQAAGGTLHWRPMLLGGLFRDIGAGAGPMATLSPAKAAYNRCDLERWARHFGVELNMPATHPMSTLRALRTLLAVPSEKWTCFIDAVFQAYWVHNKNIADSKVIADCLERAGVHGESRAKALAANDNSTVKEELHHRTQKAVARGVFGVPTWFVEVGGKEPLMFWGQDRLGLIKAVLAGWRPGQSSPQPALFAASAGAPVIDFWYDFSSPFAYLAATQIERFAKESGATVRWQPMLLGALFQQIGQAVVPLHTMPAAKQSYVARDFQYWASFWGVETSWPSRFPMKTITALRLVLQVDEEIRPQLSRALFAEYWVHDGDLNNRDTLTRILEGLDLDPEKLLAGTQDASIKEKLRAATEQATALGVFGAPTFVVHGAEPEIYWGQDRLEFIAENLSKRGRS